MIYISEKYDCCGCSACVLACSKQCISFDEDDLGFHYPLVDKELCADCGLCEKVCPMQGVLRQAREPVKKVLKVQPGEKVLDEKNGEEGVEGKAPLRVVAAYNKDEIIRAQSSSGGIFTMLAESVLQEGGVVFGAEFNERWEVVHSGVDDTKDLYRLRGAKYSQSIIGDSYKQAREFLKDGRKVLFSGTGCQIAGLKLFLRKEYDNLLTVEIACHGVPSPKVWREYVKYVSNSKQVSDIVFRDKRNGWNSYGLSIKGADSEIIYERSTENYFMQCFLNDLCMRPSCSNCPAKAGASGADLLIGDFWGIDGMHPEMYDNKGCSVVIAYSNKGKECIEQLEGKEKYGVKTLDTTFEEAYRYNRCLIESSHESRYAPIFWYNFRKFGIEAAPMTLKLLRCSKLKRMMVLGLFKIAQTIKII